MPRPHNMLAVNNVTTIRVQMRSAQMVVGFTLIGIFFTLISADPSDFFDFEATMDNRSQSGEAARLWVTAC